MAAGPHPEHNKPGHDLGHTHYDKMARRWAATPNMSKSPRRSARHKNPQSHRKVALDGPGRGGENHHAGQPSPSDCKCKARCRRRTGERIHLKRLATVLFVAAVVILTHRWHSGNRRSRMGWRGAALEIRKLHRRGRGIR